MPKILNKHSDDNVIGSGISWDSYDDLYSYTVYYGEQVVDVEVGDSAWYYRFMNGRWSGHTKRGHGVVNSDKLCVIIRGYAPADRSVQIIGTNLPYINGCSTESLLPPVRLGDPTMQLLHMPAGSSEQEEHIHSTVRVVYILDGSGICVHGLGKDQKEISITKGDVLILEKMCPHHFVTEEEPLLCSPLHIWSSVGAMEQNHPMFNGTHLLSK
jgi:mannose-6-phosphate isomerase-like protein (cupin superfamily)